MRLLMIVGLLLLATCAFCADYDWLAPDAVGVVQVTDGSIPATRIECASWNVATALERRVWLDLLDPLDAIGVGASIDVTPGSLTCAGGGYRGSNFFAYFGVHAAF